MNKNKIKSICYKKCYKKYYAEKMLNNKRVL